MTGLIRLSRRQMLVASGAMAALAVAGCGAGGGAEPLQGPQTVFKLSGRGRRVSQAAKNHNANKLFVSAAAANGNRAHPGDRSKVVPIVVSEARWIALFGNGAQAVDLRSL